MLVAMLLCVVLSLSLLTIPVQAQNFSQFKHCCQYCSPRQEKWTQVKPSWTFNIDDVTLVDFQSPTSVTPDDAIVRGVIHEDRQYQILYGGVPVNVSQHDVHRADSLLHHQYIQLDLETPKHVTGVTSQGGFYSEKTQTLFEDRQSWMTSFAVSYLDMTSSAFNYVREEDGTIKVFTGNQDADTNLVSSFHSPVTTTIIRVHPLGARDPHGDVTSAFVRVSAVVCSVGSCVKHRLHCEANPWQVWGECMCRGPEGCQQRRMRTVYEHNACGGRLCPHLVESRECTPPEPFGTKLAWYVTATVVPLLGLAVVFVFIVKRVGRDRKRKMLRQTRIARQFARQEAAREAERSMKDNMNNAEDSGAFDWATVSSDRNSPLQVAPRGGSHLVAPGDITVDTGSVLDDLNGDEFLEETAAPR